MNIPIHQSFRLRYVSPDYFECTLFFLTDLFHFLWYAHKTVIAKYRNVFVRICCYPTAFSIYVSMQHPNRKLKLCLI